MNALTSTTRWRSRTVSSRATWRARRSSGSSTTPVVHQFEGDRGSAGYLVGILLEGFLEVDLGFTALEHVEARCERWLVVLTGSATSDERLRQSCAARPEPDLERDYRRRTDSIWYWQMKAALASKPRSFELARSRRRPDQPRLIRAVSPT